jgi:tetratricopeptide (TPR) repeat protein
LGWFDAERATVLDAVALAAEWGLDDMAWELAVAMVSYYDLRSLHQDWLRGHEIALRAVRDAGNGRGEAVLLNELAQVQIYRDQFDSATANLHRSLALHHQAADRRGEALATAALGTIERVHGRYEHALDRVHRALDLVIAAGDQHSAGLGRPCPPSPHERDSSPRLEDTGSAPRPWSCAGMGCLKTSGVGRRSVPRSE